MFSLFTYLTIVGMIWSWRYRFDRWLPVPSCKSSMSTCQLSRNVYGCYMLFYMNAKDKWCTWSKLKQTYEFNYVSKEPYESAICSAALPFYSVNIVLSCTCESRSNQLSVCLKVPFHPISCSWTFRGTATFFSRKRLSQNLSNVLIFAVLHITASFWCTCYIIQTIVA